MEKNKEDVFTQNIQNISVYDFIKQLSENEYQFVLPEVQRPLAWKEAKVKSIFDNKESEYFGHITLKDVQKQTFSLIDGQQRMSIFVMAYNLVEGLTGKKSVLNSLYLDDDELNSFRKIYGPLGAKAQFSEEDIEIMHQEIGCYGYMDNYETILSIDNNIIKEKMKKSYISFSIIPDQVSEYDVFISLNYMGVSLAQSDILKAFFIKSLVDKTQPTNIKKSWKNMLRQTSKSKVILDEMIVRFLATKTKGMNKNKFVLYYKKMIEEKRNILKQENKKANLLDEFIIKEIKKMSIFVEGYSSAVLFKEHKLRLSTKSEEYFDALVQLSLTSNFIYKPYITLILEYRSSLKNDPDKLKDFFSFLLISFYMHALNKKAKKEPVEGYSFLMGNKFRTNVESIFQEYKIDKYSWQVFSVPYDSENGIYEDEEIWNQVFLMLTKKTLDNNYGKSLRVILEWYFGNDDLNFFDFKNKFSVEHIEENISIKKANNKTQQIFEKKLKYDNVVFLEQKLHGAINEEIKIWKKNLELKSKSMMKSEISNIKQNIYKHSSNPFTKFRVMNCDFKDEFFRFLKENQNNSQLFRELSNSQFANWKNQKKKPKKD